MTLNIPRSAVIFSIKSFLAAMIALYIALAAGLDNPAWSVVTAYVVAQSHAGASLSKASYRIAGTFVGAMVSIFIVPPLVQHPILLSLAISLWLGVCVSLSLIDRTARSYFFALAGYTSCIVIFPMLTQPAEIFSYGVSRFEEISIGIVCSAVVQVVILPVSTAAILHKRLTKALADARQLCIDALTCDATERNTPDRKLLAVAINEIHDLLPHVRFEGRLSNAQLLAMRIALSKLEMLMPLSLAIADRIAALKQYGAISVVLQTFLSEVVAAFTLEAGAEQIAADSLLKRCHVLSLAVAQSMNWQDLLTCNLLERTVALITEYSAFLELCERLDKTTADRKGAALDPLFNREMAFKLLPRAIDRDWRGAVGAGVSMAITVLIGNALWVASGWDQGYSAPMMAGVYFAVYAGTPNPALMLKNKFIGVVLRLLAGFVYLEAIFPAVTSFNTMVLVLAPALLVIGTLMAMPKYSALSFNLVVGIFSPYIVDRTFNLGFELYINSGMATLAGIYFAICMVTMTRFLWVDGMVRRTLAAGRRDIANLRFISAVASRSLWRSRMLHRIGLLIPRMAATSSIGGLRLDDALRDMMIGGALGQLYAASKDTSAELRQRAQWLVSQVSDYYRQLKRQPGLIPPEELRNQVDDCLRLAVCAEAVTSPAILALTSLRRNLFPCDYSSPVLMQSTASLPPAAQ